MQDCNDDEWCPLTDKQILDGLENKRLAFESGDRSAFFDALAMCARYQAIQPDWLADEILKIENDIQTGQRVDFNQQFDWKPDKSNARFNLHKRKQMNSNIIAALVEQRRAGASLDRGSDDSAFRVVARELGLPYRTIIDVYRENEWIKEIKKGHPHNIMFGEIAIPRGRRRGRSILADSFKATVQDSRKR